MKRSTLFAIIAAIVLVAGALILVQLRDDGTSATPVTNSEASTPAGATPADPEATGATGAPATETAAADEPETTANLADLMTPGALPDQVLGKASAPVTIIEYASLTCPHCAAFHKETFPALKSRYIDTGKVRFIFREFPLDNYATAGFMLARCAGEGKFFPVLDAFFDKQSELLAAPKPFDWIQGFGKQVGFTQESLDACLSNQKLLDSVMGVRQRASEKFGVNSTPTFFINGKVRRGAMSIDELAKDVDPLVRS